MQSFSNETEVNNFLKETGDDIVYSFENYKEALKPAIVYLFSHYDEYCFSYNAAELLIRKIENLKGDRVRFNSLSLVKFIEEVYREFQVDFHSEEEIDKKLRNLKALFDSGKIKRRSYPWPIIFGIFKFYLYKDKRNFINESILANGVIQRIANIIYSKLRNAGFRPDFLRIDTIINTTGKWINRFLKLRVRMGGKRDFKRRTFHKPSKKPSKNIFPVRQTIEMVKRGVKPR